MAQDDITQKLFSLAGRSALVTGASGGLGRHFARVLARVGAKVALGARRLDLLEHHAEEIRAIGGTAVGVPLDVSDSASVATAFDAAQAAHGPVDLVINNAGVAAEGWLRDTDDAAWRKLMEVNLDGVFRVGREALNRMRAPKEASDGGEAGTPGVIINIASALGFMVLPGVAPYAVSKAAVVQLTKAMALESARDGIRVNAIAPGYFPTEINRDYLESAAGKRLIAKLPQARAGDFKDLDGVLLLLASDAGRYMTGSIVSVDGGALLSLG